MAIRTTDQAVKDILLRDYDYRNDPSLTPFIRTASLIIDRVVQCATDKGITISDELALEMETWVAAYRYTHNNPVYNSKSTDGRSAGFLRQDSQNPYRLGAMELDPSGCLAIALTTENKRLGMTWLGKKPSEQIPYTDRE